MTNSNNMGLLDGVPSTTDRIVAHKTVQIAALSAYKFVYFLGVGGIGMSALARWFNANGFQVSGYDKTPTTLTDALIAEGVSVSFDASEKALLSIITLFPKNEVLVVLTPAVPKDHEGYNWLVTNGFTIKKRSEVLGLISDQHFTIAVAGTHGKTTTSSMVAHVLKAAGKHVTAFLGGITQNYGTNLLLSDAPVEDTILVVEADEYDRSFLTLHPQIAVITNTDADHLDIYHNHNTLLEAFQLFAGQLQGPAVLLTMPGSPLHITSSVKQHITYGTQNASASVKHITVANHSFLFDFSFKGKNIDHIAMSMPGLHNIENAAAAATIGLLVGLSEESIKIGLESFLGVSRRFSYHIRNKDLVYIDDYAHHPTEITAFLTSVKQLYPGWPLTVIFQPHLFSRTRDFITGFAASLSVADTVLLMPIYPARELPIQGVTSEALLDHITAKTKVVLNHDQILNYLKTNPVSLVVTIGAGNIDLLPKPITTLLNGK